MKVRLETITPTKAKKYLEKNTENRRIRQRYVDRYDAALRAGEWRLNGETIKVNCDGTLVDGQHRLWAVVQSGIPMKTYVVHGLENKDEAWETIDGGNPRSLVDRLDRNGEKYASCLAATLSKVVQFNSGDTTFRKGVRHPIARKTLADNPGVRDSVELMSRLSIGRVLPSSLAAMVHFFSGDKELAAAFWESVATGEMLKASSPAYKLREKFLHAKTSKSPLSRVEQAALCIKAWNAYAKKRPMRRLSFGEGEKFPSQIA